mgnify:CR=1 FL=1
MRRDDARGAVFEASLEPEKIVTLREIEDSFIEDVLEVFAGNKKKAARILDIDRRTLYHRLASIKKWRR